MFSISLKRPLVTITVVAAVLAAAAPASAETLVGNPGKDAANGIACDGIGAVVADRHAGRGADGFQCGGSNASSITVKSEPPRR
jgi:hypothetical protein